MQVLTIDPMTGNEVKKLSDAHCIIDGVGEDAIKIYFESEESLREFIEFRKEEDSACADKLEKVAS